MRGLRPVHLLMDPIPDLRPDGLTAPGRDARSLVVGMRFRLGREVRQVDLLGSRLTMAAFPRALTERERATLDFLLAADFPGVVALREHARAAEVLGGCECGCATIDLGVPEGMPRAELRSRVPVESVSNEPPHYELLLFTEDGRLKMLELVWYDDPPAEFPDVAVFQPPTAR